MPNQYSALHRTNAMTQLNTDIGPNAQIILYDASGGIPANVAAAVTGVALAQFAGNAGGFGTVAGGVLTASAVASATGNAAAGTGLNAAYYRINTSAGVAVVQGRCFPKIVAATSALTAANGNVLTFASAPGVSVGQSISGTGVPAGATVAAVVGATVVMSLTSTAGVASAASITFSGDMEMTNTSIASGQACNFTSLTVTAAGA